MKMNLRHLILFYCVLNLCTVLSIQAQEVNKVDEKGRKQGMWMKYHEGEFSDVLRYKGHFKDDQPVDTFFYYYTTGTLQTQLYHRPDGYVISKTFHPEGGLMAEGRYLDQKKDSSWTYYDPAGRVVSTEFFIEGEKYGLWKVYHDNGNLAAEKTWENDLENGPHRQYYRDGTLFREINFVMGSIEGRGVYYHENGQLSSEGEYYHDAKEGLWKEYNDKGELQREINYHRGIPRGGLPVIEQDTSGRYRKKYLDETDFLPEQEYAPLDEDARKNKERK